jgi:hypothetical protein
LDISCQGLDVRPMQRNKFRSLKVVAARGRMGILRAATLAVLALACGGCQTVKEHSFTARLWNTQSFRSFCEPAPAPRLALFRMKTPDDVLVQYDSVSERNEIT